MKSFERTLVLFSLFFVGFGFFVSSLSGSFLRPFFQPKPKALAPSLTYLPGVLDLREKGALVLGTESEVDPKDVVKHINEERKKAGVPELRISPTLERAAQMRADVMLKYQNPSHQDPYEHIQLDTVLPKLGYAFSYASENIALAQGNSAGFVAGWMASSAHKENLLNKYFSETGVGVTSGKVGDYYVTIAVQIFAIPWKYEL